MMLYIKSPFRIDPILLFNLKLMRYILFVNELIAWKYLQYMTENWAESGQESLLHPRGPDVESFGRASVFDEHWFW